MAFDSQRGGLAASGSMEQSTWTYGSRCPCDLDNDGLLRNGGAPDGAISIEDLLFFLQAFEAGNSLADLDNDGEPSFGASDDAVSIEDLLYFLAHFEQGC